MIRFAVAAVAVVASGCGRVGFDPTSSGSDGPPSDGRPTDGNVDDGRLDDAMPDAMRDAMPTVCSTATVVGVGRTVPLDTCSKGDRVDGCSTAGTKDLVFEFTAPTTRGYTFAARDPGSANISNSTSRMMAGCVVGTNCSGLLSFSMAAGQIEYFVVEAAGGGCAMIEFDVQ